LDIEFHASIFSRVVSRDKSEVLSVGVAGVFASDSVLPHRTSTFPNGSKVAVRASQALFALSFA
jgi:hypothetical protein